MLETLLLILPHVATAGECLAARMVPRSCCRAGTQAAGRSRQLSMGSGPSTSPQPLDSLTSLEPFTERSPGGVQP